jgi:hypothetical protein
VSVAINIAPQKKKVTAHSRRSIFFFLNADHRPHIQRFGFFFGAVVVTTIQKKSSTAQHLTPFFLKAVVANATPQKKTKPSTNLLGVDSVTVVVVCMALDITPRCRSRKKTRQPLSPPPRRGRDVAEEKNAPDERIP